MCQLAAPALASTASVDQLGLAVVAERDAALEDVARLEATLAGVLGETEDRAPGPASLCGRCVLVIGGQAHQCRHYRALVEANERVFLRPPR